MSTMCSCHSDAWGHSHQPRSQKNFSSLYGFLAEKPSVRVSFSPNTFLSNVCILKFQGDLAKLHVVWPAI